MSEAVVEAVSIGAPPRARTVSIELRWGDTDGYGHVNNVVWVRYLEEARIRTFGFPEAEGAGGARPTPVLRGLLDDGNTFTIVAGQRIEYVNELNYRGQSILADVWVSRLGSSSLTLAFAFWDAQRAELYLKATTSVVIMGLDPRRPRRITDEEREGLSAFVGDAPDFR